MVSWTPEYLREYERKNSAKRLPAVESKPVEGKPLERINPRKKENSNRIVKRAQIRWRMYSVKPCDWDGFHIKEIQDLLIHAGVLHGDEWYALECAGVVSEKVYNQEEERTEIEITYPEEKA